MVRLEFVRSVQMYEWFSVVGGQGRRAEGKRSETRLSIDFRCPFIEPFLQND